MNKIDPHVLAELMSNADFMPGEKALVGAERLAALIVEQCAAVAEFQEGPGAREAGAAIRKVFGLNQSGR